VTRSQGSLRMRTHPTSKYCNKLNLQFLIMVALEEVFTRQVRIRMFKEEVEQVILLHDLWLLCLLELSCIGYEKRS
jgi:hypothetical protein